MRIVYAYQLPDPLRPISSATPFGPSGELRPFRPPPVDPAEILGRRAEAATGSVGTYGMGGPGFFGLRFGERWLVVAVWGAAAWMRLDNRCVEDRQHAQYGRPAPWLSDEPNAFATLEARLTSSPVTHFEVTSKSLVMAFENGATLCIDEDASHRPRFEGDGEPRAFECDDDLRKAVFFSPTTEIWFTA